MTDEFDVYHLGDVEVRVPKGTPIEITAFKPREQPPEQGPAGVWHVPASLCRPDWEQNTGATGDTAPADIVIDKDR